MIRLAALLRLLSRLAWDLLCASCLLAWDILTPADRRRMRVLRFATRARGPAELWLLATAISLTPGTLVLDVEDGGGALFIHALYAHDPERVLADLRERIETPLLTVLRGGGPC